MTPVGPLCPLCPHVPRVSQAWVNPSDPRVPPRVAQAYVNQRKLDQEVKTLQVQAAQFARQTGQWIAMVESFNQALKVGNPP